MAKIYTATDFDLQSAAVSLGNTLLEILKNPDAIKQASKDIAKTSQMSAEMRNEVLAGQATLDASKASSEALIADKQAFELYRTKHSAKLEQDQKDLESKQFEFESNRARIQNELISRSEALKKLELSVLDKVSQNTLREKSLKELEDALALAEAQRKKREARLDAQEKVHNAEVEKLAAKKKRLADAAKED